MFEGVLDYSKIVVRYDRRLRSGLGFSGVCVVSKYRGVLDFGDFLFLIGFWLDK